MFWGNVKNFFSGIKYTFENIRFSVEINSHASKNNFPRKQMELELLKEEQNIVNVLWLCFFIHNKSVYITSTEPKCLIATPTLREESPAEQKNAELKNANLVQDSHSFIPHFSGILDHSQSFIPHFLNSRLHFFQWHIRRKERFWCFGWWGRWFVNL